MKNKISSLIFGLSFMMIGSIGIVNAQVSDIGSGGTISDGETIICKCNFWKKCKASGSRAACAQSTEGGNVQCSNYNGNC